MYYKNENLSIYYEKYGTGEKNIIILPGWGDTRKTFDFLISNLEKDYTIYIFDYPGFGKTPFPNKDMTIYDYAEFFQDFITDKKLQESIIISHSFGGRISILLASIYNIKIEKMILIDAAGIKPKKKISQYLKQTLYKILKKAKLILPRKKRKLYQKWLLKKFSSTDYQALPPEMMKTFRNVIGEDLRKYLKEINTETLLIWGECDLDTPLLDGILMEKGIKDSALITIHHATHFSYLEQPFLVLRIINHFIKEKDRI